MGSGFYIHFWKPPKFCCLLLHGTHHYVSLLILPACQTIPSEILVKCHFLPSKLFYRKQIIWKRSITCNEIFNAAYMWLTIFRYWPEMGKERTDAWIQTCISTTMLSQAKKASLEAVWPSWEFRLLGEKVGNQDTMLWGNLSVQDIYRQQKLL